MSESLDQAARLDAAIDALLRGDEQTQAQAELQAAEMLAVIATAIPESKNREAIRSSVLVAQPQRSRRRRWMILAPIAATFAFSGVATAARNAAPGDALYPIRRGMQAVRVAVAIGDDSRAVALLDRVERDLLDARGFLAAGDRRGVRHALDVFEDDLDNARRVIGTLERPARDRLDARADSLEREARGIRDTIEDRSGPSGKDDDSSGSGSGDDSSGSESGGDDRSGSGGSGSGSDSPAEEIEHEERSGPGNGDD